MSPLIACLTSYKYRLSRMALETMYKSFILPHFDYADIVWDNCTNKLAEELENLHLDAIRTIIGAVRGTSHEKLYFESGFTTLKERRTRHKIVMFHKIVNCIAPSYLTTEIPALVSTLNPYHRRQPLQRQIPPHKLELYKLSFFPSATVLWNNLPENIQSSTSISELKRYLSMHDRVVPYYFYLGDRKSQTIHSNMRLNASNLNQDLVHRHLSQDSSCDCGALNETAEHYLLECPRYSTARKETINKLPYYLKNINTLLHGNEHLPIQSNELVFSTVLNFISQTDRFGTN